MSKIHIDEILEKAKEIQVEKEAEAGDLDAIYKKGQILYEKGNIDDAYKIWEEIAKQGHKKAKYEIGKRFYELGQQAYKIKDYDKAEEYWENALRNHYSNAKKVLDKLYKNELCDKYTTWRIPDSAVHRTCGGNARSYRWNQLITSGRIHPSKYEKKKEIDSEIESIEICQNNPIEEQIKQEREKNIKAYLEQEEEVRQILLERNRKELPDSKPVNKPIPYKEILKKHKIKSKDKQYKTKSLQDKIVNNIPIESIKCIRSPRLQKGYIRFEIINGSFILAEEKGMRNKNLPLSYKECTILVFKKMEAILLDWEWI